MSNGTSTFQIAITSANMTDKGAKGAEKRLDQVQQRAARGITSYSREMDRATGRAGQSMISVFSRVGRASERAFAGGPGGAGNGIMGRMSALSTAGRAAASGMGEASVAGGVLEGALAAIAAPAIVAVGVLSGVALAADKLTSSWAKSLTGSANLAATIGVSTQALQEFQAVAERAGIDKGTAAGSFAGLANALNAARHGRNKEAAGTLAYLGVKTRLNRDGTVNVEAMLPEIANAISRQTAYGAKQVSDNLGMGDAGATIMRMGGAKFRAEMADAAKYANVATDADINTARGWHYRRTRVGQMMERGANRAGETAATAAGGVLDRAARFGTDTIDTGGQNIRQGAETFALSVTDQFAPAAKALARAVAGWQNGGRFEQAKVQRMARGAMPIYQALLRHGDSPADAAAWAAAAYAESSGNPHMQQRGGKNAGYGLFQWDAERRALFQKVMGRSIYGSSTEDQLRFRDYELAHGERRAGRWIAAAQGEQSKADAITRFYERPKFTDRDAADRSNVAGAIRRTENVHHHVHFTLEDKRTTMKARSSGTKYPIVFHQIPE